MTDHLQPPQGDQDNENFIIAEVSPTAEVINNCNGKLKIRLGRGGGRVGGVVGCLDHIWINHQTTFQTIFYCLSISYFFYVSKWMNCNIFVDILLQRNCIALF